MWIDGRTRPIGLLGDPVEHSFSPLLHNTAAEALGLNVVYVAMRVSEQSLETAVTGLDALGFLGANVTIPHKRAVMPLMDELSDQARAVGAVNTIVFRRDGSGKTVRFGDNTDVAGFLAPLEPYVDRLKGSIVTVFGSGGASRAVVYGLLNTIQPERLNIVARNAEKANRLVEDLSGYDPKGALTFVPLTEAGPVAKQSKLLVNATPLGMSPDVGSTPSEDRAVFSEDQVVYDLVYNPERTRFLQDAESRGATSIGGLDMLLGQAAASFIQWTGVPMPLDRVREALKAHLTDKPANHTDKNFSF